MKELIMKSRSTVRLIMTIGIPGSGKSTWIKKQILSPNALIKIIVVSPDRIRQEEFSDVSHQGNNVEVWDLAKDRTRAYLLKGTSVILDATNVNTVYRAKFLLGLPECRLQAKLFPANPEDCWERIKNDIKLAKNRANVPREIIYRMHGEYQETSRVIASEGFELIEDIFK